MYERELRKKLYEEELLSKTLNYSFYIFVIDAHLSNSKEKIILMNVFDWDAELIDFKKDTIVTENSTKHYFIAAHYEVLNKEKGIKLKKLYDGLEKIRRCLSAAVLEIRPFKDVSNFYYKTYLIPSIKKDMKEKLPYTLSIKLTTEERVEFNYLKDKCKELFPDVHLKETYKYNDLNYSVVVLEEENKYESYGEEIILILSYPTTGIIFRNLNVDKNYLENWFKLFTSEINPNYIISQTHSFVSNEIEKIINAMYN
ncbi:MAG: hypothetical protein QXS69_02935 [Candidatus Aenigmatarchaeota archaeon]